MRTDKQSIETLGLTNPIVRQFLDYHNQCQGTWEVALTHMVHALANQNNQLMADALHIRQRGLPPTIIVTSQEQADQIRAAHAQPAATYNCHKCGEVTPPPVPYSMAVKCSCGASTAATAAMAPRAARANRSHLAMEVVQLVREEGADDQLMAEWMQHSQTLGSRIFNAMADKLDAITPKAEKETQQ